MSIGYAYRKAIEAARILHGGDPVGWGRTEAEAISDLEQQESDRDE